MLPCFLWNSTKIRNQRVLKSFNNAEIFSKKWILVMAKAFYSFFFVRKDNKLTDNISSADW